MISESRASGRSTRLVDALIQEFFENGFCVAKDHHPTRQASLSLLRTAAERLHREHSFTKFIVNESTLTITLQKEESHE